MRSSDSGAEIGVLCVSDDPDRLDRMQSALADRSDFQIRSAASVDAELEGFDGVDCLVSEHASPADALEFLTAVRERAPSLPVVVCLDGSTARTEESDESVTSLTERAWTACLLPAETDVAPSLLAARIRRLVDHRRLAAKVERARAGLDVAGDAIAIVGPEGRLEFVTGAYATRFGYESDELVGRSWQVCHPDDEVQRLQSTALPSVRDDWQWTGGCVGRRRDGETFTARTRIAGLDDGSLMFCLSASLGGT